jgi:hypothetical protein
LLSQAEAASSVPLAWNPGASSSIAGYRLYYGTSSGSYPNVLNVGNTTPILHYSSSLPSAVSGRVGEASPLCFFSEGKARTLRLHRSLR